MTAASRLIHAVGATVLLAGCTVGPDYKHPDSPVPPGWAGLDGASVASAPDGGTPDVATWWDSVQ